MQPTSQSAVDDVIQVERKKVRVAVVGCGYWGSKHLRVLNGNVDAEVHAVDSDPLIRSSISRAFPNLTTHASLAEALAQIDAVVIATPAQTHFELALLSLRSGKHVLVEKPFTTTFLEASLLVGEAASAGRTLMVGHTFLFVPAVRELRRRIKNGELGRVKYIHSSRLNLGLHRGDVNVIWDLAPHDISIANYLLDSYPTSVSAWASSLTVRSLEDLAYVRFDYGALDVSVYSHMSWLDPKKSRTLTVVGSRRMAIYDDMADERLRIYDRGLNGQDLDPAVHERPMTYRYGEIISPFIGVEEPLYLEGKHFIDVVQELEKPICTGMDGMVSVAVLEAIDESIRTQKTILINYRSQVGADILPPMPGLAATVTSSLVG